MSSLQSTAVQFVKKLSVIALVCASSSLYASNEVLELAPMAASVGAKLSEKPVDERYVDDATAEVLKARLQTIVAVPAEPMLRSEVLAANEEVASLQRNSPQRAGRYHDFAFYGAFSRLFEDRDHDGFHRSFSVTFDADLYSNIPNEVVPVYAVLYLSRNGGNWVRYFTTETFYIRGANAKDDYEVVTTLAEGYLTDHYDVLVDLYEVGYSGVVATISSDDTNGLHALPLESANRDTDYKEDDEGGSVGAGLLAILIFALLGRERKRDRD